MVMNSGLNRRSLLTTAITAAIGDLFRLKVLGAAYPFSRLEETMTALSQSLLYSTSLSSTTLIGEAADRVAIRELIDSWAHFADRRMADQQAALFVAGGGYSVYDGDPAKHKPLATRRGHDEIVSALGALNKYTHTTHFNGQSTIVVKGDRGVGECYCLAYQLYEESGQRKLQLLSIRYYDDYVREKGRWLFAERKLIVDWSETRSSAP